MVTAALSANGVIHQFYSQPPHLFVLVALEGHVNIRCCYRIDRRSPAPTSSSARNAVATTGTSHCQPFPETYRFQGLPTIHANTNKHNVLPSISLPRTSTSTFIDFIGGRAAAVNSHYTHGGRAQGRSYSLCALHLLWQTN
jgi:hypothetical protein